MTWTLGKDYVGWIGIKVLSPETMESNKAEFEVNCTSGPFASNAVLREAQEALHRRNSWPRKAEGLLQTAVPAGHLSCRVRS